MKASENQSLAAYPRRHTRHPTASSMAKWRFQSESGAKAALARCKKGGGLILPPSNLRASSAEKKAPSARNDGKYLPFPPCEKPNSTDPRRTQTDEAAGHHQNPTSTMEESQRNLGRLLSHFTLPSPHVEGKMDACANPAVFVFHDPRSCQARRMGRLADRQKKKNGGTSRTSRGGVAAFKGTASCEAIYVISSLLVFFPVVPIYNMQTMRNFTRFGLKFYSVFAYTLCLCPVYDSVLCFPRFCLSFHRFWLYCLVFKVLARSRILAWVLNQLS